MQQPSLVVDRGDPSDLDLASRGAARWNLTAPVLVQLAVRQDEAMLVADGCLLATTGQHTGRSPNDRFIVDAPEIRDQIDWGEVNRPISVDRFTGLWRRACAHAARRMLYVQDLHAGADPAHRLRVRVVTETAWHSLFARNMFRAPASADLAAFESDFTVLQLPSLEADPATDGTRSEVAILVDLVGRRVLICGTSYAGEIKKSIFGVLNFLLPPQGVLPMHCSANTGGRGDVALFFGLSGTGKTTLSADPARVLIGDDEHGWASDGVFNFEGGCYAKVIRLSAVDEPEIFAASTRFGAILENVIADPATGAIDFDADRLTENTRASYPLAFIPNASDTGRAGHPTNVVMLTADAFGVLPPISKLTPEQAMYHFLSGYTARVAGTEQGVKEPQATFSTCFGAPFMPRHPTVYANLLGDLMRRHDVNCWLVNTGWSGGPYGVGARMQLKHTRALLRAALDGDLAAAPLERHATFGLLVPQACRDVPSEILLPERTWADQGAYQDMARDVAGRFATNFDRFRTMVDPSVEAAGIHVPA